MYIKTLDYVENDQVFYPIDGLKNEYEINYKKVVRNTKTKEILSQHIANKTHIYVSIRRSSFPLNKLFMMAFFPMHTTFEIYQDVLKIGARDGDICRIERNNLYWIIPEKKGIECKYKKGYYSIVGNPEVIVNRDLNFYSLTKERELNISISSSGYAVFTGYGNYSRDDFKLASRAVHRLVCLAFHQIKPGSDYVNHINGKKEDYSVDNLEWVNHTENRIHAVESGLCVQSKRVYFHNVITKNEFQKASLWEAGRTLGLHATVIGNAINAYLKDGSLLLAPFIITNDPADIKPFDQRNLKVCVIGNGPTKYYKVEHSERLFLQYVRGRVALATLLGVCQTDKRLLMKYLSTREFEFDKYIVTPVHREEIPDEFFSIVHGQKGGGKVQKPISVTHLKSGVVTEYPDTDTFATLVGALRKTIQRRMLYNNGVWNGYRIEFLK